MLRGSTAAGIRSRSNEGLLVRIFSQNAKQIVFKLVRTNRALKDQLLEQDTRTKTLIVLMLNCSLLEM